MSTEAYAALASDITVDAAAHLAALGSLQAEHALTLDQLSAARRELAVTQEALSQANTRHDIDQGLLAECRLVVSGLEETVDRQAAEIKRLMDIIDPPPATKRILDYHYARPGGGGGNAVENMNGAVIVGLDVGANVLFPPGSWEGMKWNAGLGGARHSASITIDTNGEAILHDGPGSKNGDAQGGVFVLDALAKDWNGPAAGTKAAYVCSQNSYGDPYAPASQTGAWRMGYGTWEQRSVGRLTWRRANGDFVCGQFGWAGDGRGGVCVISAAGAKRVIPQTETWACRAVQRMSDSVYYVSVELARIPDTALPTPGGLWLVNVETNTVARLGMYPDTPEHIDTNGTDTVVACRDKGIWRDGTNITGNLTPASEWYSIAIRDDGAIVAGCMNPALTNGRYWSVVVLDPGASVWRNITPPPLASKTDAQATLNDAPPFTATNRGNTLGMSGATVTDVAWRGDVPVCFAAGILYGAPTGTMQPAPGDWITVRRAYDRTPDGYEAFAVSDFNAQARKPGGDWVNVGFAGGNDGADVSWVGHVLHYRGPSGERQAWNADTGAFIAASGTMPPKNPQADMPDDVRAAIIQTMEVQHFGERYGTWALSPTDLLIYGHGSAVSREVPA